MWTSIQFSNSKPLLVASYYHPKKNDIKSLDNMFSSFEKCIAKNKRQYPNVIIGGDYNLPDINWTDWSPNNTKTKSYHEKFLNFLVENSLSQLQTKITRPISNSVLDLLVTTNPNIIENMQVVPGISDHLVVLFDVCMKPKFQKKPQRKIYMFDKADKEALQADVADFVNNFLQSNPENQSCDTNWQMMRDTLSELVEKHVPSKLSKGKRSLPWITADVKRKMRKRDKLFSKARKTSLSADWKAYKAYRNNVTKLVRNSHHSYINDVIGNNLTQNPKSFWSYVKLNKTENLGIPTLKTTKMCSTDLDKANALNSHFKSVFNPKGHTHVSEKGQSPYSSIPHLNIGVEGVAKQLQNLNPNKARGPDKMSPRLLKIVATEIAPALAFLFQQSFDTTTTPTQWKQALVSAIYKSGSKADPSNYRPISLTCLCCKIMEHIVLSHMAKHLNSHRILIDDQHGFRERLSTVTQLINSTNDWSETLNKKGQTDVILLDFSKAFDKVSHQHLSNKLSFYGIRGNTLGWINSFLSDRQQAVSVNGTHSSWVDVTSGVPQGSVLGPALFLLYINDINDHIKSKIKLFADDSIVYREIWSPEDHNILQQDLDTLAEWSKTWLMHFNVKKCASLSITRKRNPKIFQYFLMGEFLNRVQKHDYLGVTIAHDLRWNDHCSKVINKASRTLGLLRRTLSPCTKAVKSQAYSTLVRPQLEYASEIWNPNTTSEINRLEQVQRSSARFVFADYNKRNHVTPLIQELNWDSLHTRRLIQQATMLYRIQYALVNICHME